MIAGSFMPTAFMQLPLRIAGAAARGPPPGAVFSPGLQGRCQARMDCTGEGELGSVIHEGGVALKIKCEMQRYLRLMMGFQ